MFFIIIERSASAEFTRVDRSLKIHNATEVNFDKLILKKTHFDVILIETSV
jgi:hypothetical protein